MIILRLSAHRGASLMRGPEDLTSGALFAACPVPDKSQQETLGMSMGGLLQMADERWEHSGGAGGGRSGRGISGPGHGAAARLWLLIVRWQLRRLERRMAALEVDDRSLY